MISVAMATYNGEKYILKQLNSILKQTHQPDEVIICDDQSSDKTVFLIKNFIRKNKLEDKWKIFVNNESLGFIRNFLKAIFLTNGDIIFLSDQDDIFLQNKFEVMLHLFQQYPDCKVLNANYSIIDENSNAINNYRLHTPKRRFRMKKLNFELYLYNSNYPGFSMGFRKEIVEKIKELDIEDIYGHDIVINMIGLSLSGCYVSGEILSNYRMHQNNTSGIGKVTNNLDINSRIAQKNNELNEYEKLLSFISKNDLFLDKNIVINRKNELEKRINYLKQGSIIKLFHLLMSSKTYPKNTILGLSLIHI